MQPIEVLLALRCDGEKVYDVSGKCNRIFIEKNYDNPSVNITFDKDGPIAKGKALYKPIRTSHIFINTEISTKRRDALKPYWIMDEDVPWTCCAWINIEASDPYGTLINGGRVVSYQRLSTSCSTVGPNIITTGGWPTANVHNMLDYNKWYHIAFVKHSKTSYSIYINGKREWTGPVDNPNQKWDFATRGMGILTEYNGDNNSSISGKLYDMTFIRGKDLWNTETFTLPTDYVIDEYNIPIGTTVPNPNKPAEPTNSMKPKYDPTNCIFYLSGVNELIGKYQFDSVSGGSAITEVEEGVVSGRKAYKCSAPATRAARVLYKIKNPTTDKLKTFSISFWAKKGSIRPKAGWEQMGFLKSAGQNFGLYSGYEDVIFNDDSQSSDYKQFDIYENLDATLKDWVFFTICRDGDEKKYYISVNGYQINNGTPRWLNDNYDIDFDKSEIAIFDIDGSGAFGGVIDEVIIHEGVCLYKDDFKVDGFLPANIPTPPPTILVKSFIKVY